MSVLPLDAQNLTLDRKAAEAAGAALAEEYQSGKPFHYIGVDNFLPLEITEKVREEALMLRQKEAEHSSLQEHLKSSYNPDTLPDYSRSVFHAFNSLAFIRFLEEMTGITGLIPDPYYFGAGIHRTETGGYLGIHADFNYHQRMNLERRLNVLIYLNPDWKDEYGGAFEVWNSGMKNKVAGFTPVMNRMCCFSTTSDSWHGNPEPVNHPEDEPRLSIALYYYTATWDEGRIAHSTLFKPRPGTTDVAARTPYIRKGLEQALPPIVYRGVSKVLYRMGM
ncbi:2OG-Fe(II) oxygenase [Pseudaestuariivita sp.]|uniref:2OG-Fe(II) oxygenase n=1 Tax=Pseudaestuariivita sp. TaxID=2211669 RepID=UPI00405A126C